ncbi:hypothetical protein DM02DRAFT_344363 [Periconia macrospinosa]|uniref:Uncharacterized protein n=1 Tax=Periconia macrospinosa TaxID=97972 RepID=A0A2V1DU10_9PLEO|nr:hypothetical protein DM02DRAFT_344363 [Periconia macrospinosa]
MPSGSQSPGPKPATSQPKQARSKKAATPSQKIVIGRSGSAGGIVLENEQTRKKETSPKSAIDSKSVVNPATDNKMNTTAVKNDEKGNEAASASRPKRKPRKLNREPAPDKSTAPTPTTATTVNSTSSPAAAAELEALKSRVRGLEAKVEELYTSTGTRPGRSPRRRGKGRKGSSATQVPTLASTAAPTPVENEEELADEELTRLEDELEDARRDLMLHQPHTRPRTKRSTSEDTEYVEEIPREGGRTVTTGDRQVTLSGSYRIPLPATLSMDDVKSIQNGVSAAQNVAKSFLDQRRASQASRSSTQPAASKPAPKATSRKTSAPTAEVSRDSRDNNGKSWGEWFGGYSVAISKAMKNIEAEAAIESQRAAGASAPRPGKTSSAKKAASNIRPGMKAQQSNLSSEQVLGLMS